jgi:site-specific DNA recombinase
MKTQIARPQGTQLAAELAALAKSPTATLKQQWRALYATNPPPRIGRGLLMRAIAYRLQERALGGLKPATRRLLERLAAEGSAEQPLRLTTPSSLSAGTILMREWQGVTHEVVVLEQGVRYHQKHYRSLSEVARRIRDKIAASKQKGMWMGGTTPLGYDVRQRQLIINQAEATTVRLIYQLYLRLGSVRLLKAELDRRGLVSKVRVSKTGLRSGGCRFGRGALYEMLANPIYIGQIRHRQLAHPGQHPPILERTVWERVQRKLREQAARTGRRGTRTATSPLAGKLFDARGEPLYVCGAVKGTRRYRYYVSRKLVRGGRDSDDRGWRLAAPELEKTVDAAVRRLLSDPAALSRAVRHSRMSAAELQQLLAAAKRHAAQLDDRAAETLTDLVDRVELRADGMELTLDLRSLRHSQESAGTPAANLKITQVIPLQIKRRGVETRLVIPGAIASTTRTDPALLRVVARAHRWFNEIASGAVTSTSQIAHGEGLSHSYVRHALPLGLLAPSIVEAICEGRQPVALTAERLKDHRQLSLEWTAQQRQLSH